MKTSHRIPIRPLLALLIFLMIRCCCPAQGRVVINEYMPWTLNGCGATAEFVELLNFGPGPVDIGCYILTDGDFSITIPANTILYPGEFYLIAGQDTIAYPCANIDSTVHSDLNWSTCNCTSGTIPTTGDGFLTDGGSANEQVVLLDPSLNIIDAVVRSFPVESSQLITTSTAGGQCTSQAFDLDLININYETIGESAGRGNSFARRLDGDCGWVKDPQQSGNATNNTSGDISSITYELIYITPWGCPKGSVVIQVDAPNYSDIFPMNYTLGYDSDSDGVFELTDQYITGIDSSANTIPLNDLASGTYRITVASAKGCNLKTLSFTIFPCGTILPVKLLSFTARPANTGILCNWSLDHSEDVSRMEIESSSDGISFRKTAIVYPQPGISGRNDFLHTLPGFSDPEIYLRLVIYDKTGGVQISPVMYISNGNLLKRRLWPNPAKDVINIEILSGKADLIAYLIYDNQNRLLKKGNLNARAGINKLTIPLNGLAIGNYRILLRSKDMDYPPTLLGFIKL